MVDVLCELGHEDSVVFKNPDYKDAIIGVSLDGNVVYEYRKMVRSLMKDGMSEEEAAEFIDYNTVRAIPYIGDKAPIIILGLGGD